MEELAAYVCSKLGEEGIDTVLSGGSYVQIYSIEKWSGKENMMEKFYQFKQRVDSLSLAVKM